MDIDFLSKASQLGDQIVAWRRDFHKHPELAFEEHRTAGIVAEELHRLGMDVKIGIGTTGVVGILEGASDGPTVLVRADMDALPIIEANEVPYVSVNDGVMHACGHDGHTAIGLGLANIFTQERSRLQGRLMFVFQPAEESAVGAKAMIDEGLFNKYEPDVALGIHLWNSMPLGQVGLTPGPAMAGSDTFEIIIRGRGGHGAMPHETRDPLLAATQVVSALQSVVSRNISPLESAVLSVTALNAGTTFNVIPAEARMQGTIRTYRPEIHDITVQRLLQVTTGISEAMGCEATITVNKVTPPLVNDPTVTKVVATAIGPYVEQNNVLPDIKTMGAEDMALFLDRIPGCFIMVGSANAERNLNYPHHHPKFDFDEAALPFGAALFASAVAAYVIPG